MELVNATSIPAKVFTSRVFGGTHRIGTVVAKATFRLTERGPELETQEPVPLLGDDHETELGLVPRDDLPRRDDAFEVVLLGAAYALDGRPTPQRRVALAVGEERRELVVFGDRVWESRTAISEPQPFVRMPLGHARAFGGSTEVEIDRESFLPVADPRNPEGRGFDPGPGANGLKASLGCPDGYPRYDQRRPLPNVEDPSALIHSWEDAPPPLYWSAVPFATAIQADRSVLFGASADGVSPDMAISAGAYHRAHPSWVVALPLREAEITIIGLTPAQDVVSFSLPAIQVFVDYVAGLRTGTRELVPQSLILLPEEKKLCLVFRHSFTFEYPSGERSLRLRVALGDWHDPSTKGA